MSDYISEDNLVLIFKYLPVKSLLRFRSMCKDWKQLIDSPTLVQQHLSVQKPRFVIDPHGLKYLVVDASLPRPLVSTLSKPIEKKGFLLVGTLHGVVCLCDYDSSPLLWNPSLRKFMSLPIPSDFRWYLGIPMYDYTCYGFWIDPSTKEFKALILQRKPVASCILYSSIRHGWSTGIRTEEAVNWKPCKDGPPAMIQGVAHWGGCLDEFVDDSNHFEHNHRDKAILSFDFVQESFEVIRMPDLYCRNYAACRWQGTLSFVCRDDEFPPGCEIYSRKEGSWAKMFDFEVYEPIRHSFWAMEDAEERRKKGKRKRGVEVGLGDAIRDPRPSVRILAGIIDDSREMTSEQKLVGKL